MKNLRFVASAINSSTGKVLLFCLWLGLLTACSDSKKEKAEEQLRIDEQLIKDYLTENNLQANRTSSGLYYIITDSSNGRKAEKGNMVRVLYTGKFLDGRVFDSSANNGNEPIAFRLGSGQVIKGWEEGIALMHEGEKATLLLPSRLAYGTQGSNSIPPNTVLLFEVELVEVIY